MESNRRIFLVFMVLVALFLRTFMLSSTPGLHFDEARTGNDVIHVLYGGGGPLLTEQQPYNGNFNYYLVATSFVLNGEISVFTMRILHSLLNVMAILLVYLALREYDGDIAFYTLGLLAVIPYNIVFSHVSFVFYLVPFFVALGFYLLVKYLKHERDVYLLLFAFVMGLGVQTQVGVVVLLGVFLLYLLLARFRILLKWRVVLVCVILFAVGLYPILLSEFKVHGLSNMIMTRPGGNKEAGDLNKVVEKYGYYFKDLKGVLDGQIAYLRTAGSVIAEPPPVNSILVLISGLWIILSLLWMRDDLRKLTALIVVLPSVIYPYFFMLFGYTYADRYFVYFFPVGLLSAGIMLGDMHKRWEKVAMSLFTIILLVNVVYVSVNFFYNFMATEGSLETFDIGFPETSHFPAVTSKLVPLLEGRNVYYLEKGNPCDMNSILQFYMHGKAEYHTLRDLSMDFENGGFYFTVDLDDKNDSLREFYQNRKPDMYVEETLFYRNMMNETKMTVYILGQGNVTQEQAITPTGENSTIVVGLVDQR
ncbi:MAG: glycosyltransferase family 39 protein [Candidatus Altiarchaeota archaeon]|nr:glycosyltransferase family 39 protein [Candidatus Altiarchaeota archaeon]